MVLDARTGFEDNDLDALLRKLVAQCSTARARAHDHDHAAVIPIEFCHLDVLLIVCCPGLDLREPVDIGEAAFHVTAMFGGGAFVAELGP